MSAVRDRPLRILHCNFRRGWAGGENQLLLLAQGLRRRGHAQWIATPEDSVLGRRAAAEGFRVVHHPYSGEVDPRAYLNLVRAARRARPDVIHAHEAHAVVPARAAAWSIGRRTAVIAHRRVDNPLRSTPLSTWKYARAADRLITVSDHVRHVLERGGVPGSKIDVIRSGVEVDSRTSASTPPLRARVDAPAEAPLIVTIASIMEYKDHPTLIRAAARLEPRDPMPRWVVLGGGELLGAMRSRVETAGLGERVHYLGHLPGARAYLPEADLFVLTSKTEGLGTSVLDAMASNCPVVATRAGGIPEMIEPGVSGLLVDVGDAAGLAISIDRLLDDPPLAARLATAARLRVTEEFSIGAVVRATEAVYRSTLRSREEPDGAG